MAGADMQEKDEKKTRFHVPACHDSCVCVSVFVPRCCVSCLSLSPHIVSDPNIVSEPQLNFIATWE